MFPVGLSTCSKTADGAFFRACAAAGISAVEVSPDADAYDAVDWTALRRYADETGVALRSFHLPFLPFAEIDVSATDPALRAASVRRDADLIRRAADAGVGIFVIHPGGEPVPDAERAARLEASRESLAALADVAVSCGGVLAVEDLPRTCPGRDSGEILFLLQAHPALRVCFDTNHLLRESPQDFIRRVGDKIVTTHVSDYDFKDEKHWLPGEGDVDWYALADALADAGYGGVWLYELGFRAPWTVRRGRDLTPGDFVRNAKEIFSHSPITLHGSRR